MVDAFADAAPGERPPDGDSDASAGRRTDRRGFLAGAGTAVAAGTAGCLDALPFGGGEETPSDLAPEDGDDEWPMPGATPAQTGYMPENDPPSEGSIAWRTDVGARIATDPVVHRGVVALGLGPDRDGDNRVVALEAETGDVLWEREVTGAGNAGIAAANGRVVHLGGLGRVTAFGATSGEVAWDQPGQNTYSEYGDPTVLGSTVLVPKRDGVHALELADGSRQWRHEIDGSVPPSTVAVLDGTAAYARAFRGLTTFDVDQGTRLQTFDTDPWVPCSPSIVDELVVTQTERGNVYGVDLATGFERWSLDLGRAGTVMPVAVHPDVALVDAMTRDMWAIDLSEPGTAWRFREGGVPAAPASIVGQRAYVVTFDDTLSELDVATGTVHWDVTVEGTPARRPAVTNGRSIVAAGEQVVAVE